MMQKLLPSLICYLLCPLLVAQSVAAEAQQQTAEPAASEAVHMLPMPATLDYVKGRKIQLVAQEPVSIEAAMTGAPFQLVVDRDVVVDGVTVIHSKTPVTAMIVKVNRGSYERGRSGHLDLRLSYSGGGRPVVVRLGGIPPEPVYHVAADNPWTGIGEQLERTFLVTGIVIGTIFLLVVLAAVI